MIFIRTSLHTHTICLDESRVVYKSSVVWICLTSLSHLLEIVSLQSICSRTCQSTCAAFLEVVIVDGFSPF